ncbi:MAG: hypothetical protein K6C96_01920 [Butyrivibrio sp.]|nr:hypothetical protein [Butyrivibrio sp.]
MDFKYNVKKENVSTYNPLEYTEAQMSFTNIKQEDADAHPQTLFDRGQTLQDKLLGMGIETVDSKQMQNNAISFEDRVNATKEFARTQAATMAKTTKAFGNSAEMDAIIRMVNGLNSLLEGDIPKINGRVDTDVLKQKHLKGYEAAINACQYYLDTKTPKYAWTKRRYRRVEAMKLALEKERELLSVVVANIADQKYKAEDLTDVQTPRDLLAKSNSLKVIGTAELQVEGNSTDVYRVRLTVNGKEGWYYFKQNLKPVGDDLKGFIDRRLRQLGNSKQHMGDSKKEEARLNGKIDEKDYDYGQEFLNKMKDKLASVSESVKDTRALNKRYLSFLGHDFDKVFQSLTEYNARAEESKTTLIALKADLAKAKKEGVKLAQDALEAQIKAHKVFEPMDEYQWLVKMAKSKDNPLGLNLSKDKALFDILKRMSKEEDSKNKEGGNNRISRFFTVTLGKEIEAYGQQADRSNASNDEVMAKNNTATYRMANLFGFNDVVTSSESAVINIKLAGNKEATDVSGTISVEAPGVEMLKLVEIAEKNGRKIHYSPTAIRQLVRLQMFDTSVLQTDRHWRNFKCKTQPDLTNYDENKPLTQDIVIDTIGSYDHDMSFGVMDLKDAFKDKENPDGPSVKNGMLPPVIRKIARTSPEAAYYNARLLGGANLNLFENMLSPMPRVGSEYEKTHRDNVKKGRYQYKTITLKELGIKSADELPKRTIEVEGEKRTVYDYNGMTLKKNTLHKDALYICDEKGVEQGHNVIDKYLYNETKLGIMYLNDKDNDTTEMIRASKMLDGSPVPEKFTDKIISRCKAIAKHIKYKEDTSITSLDELKKEEKIDVLVNAMLLHSNLDQIDVTDNSHEKKVLNKDTGYMEHRLRIVIYNLKLQLDTMPPKEKEDLLAEVKVKVLKILDSEKKEEYGDQKDDKEDPNYMEVPTMLHMDKKAYLDIVSMRDRFDTDVKFALHDLGWAEDKIAAFKQRLEQQITDIEKCRDMAEKILAKKYPEKSKLRSFFLEAKDFDQIKDINEIAWDPGMSYFATEDENYLMSDPYFKEFLTQEERQTRLKNTNEHRKIKRMHGLKQDLSSYSTMISGRVGA